MKNKDNISRLNKATPYQVPDNYFDKLADSIQAKIALEEETESKTYGVLESLKVSKVHPFQVPENYFSELPGIIQDKTLKSTKSSPLISIDWSRTKTQLALVPVMMMLLVAGYFFYTPSTSHSDELQASLEEISTEDLVAYLEASDISTEDIIAAIDIDYFDLDTDIEETDMLDELNLSDDEMDDILLEFEIESGV